MLLPILISIFGKIFGPPAVPLPLTCTDRSRQRYTVAQSPVDRYSIEQKPRNLYDVEQP